MERIENNSLKYEHLKFFLTAQKLKIVWIKIATFFRRRVSNIL